MPPSPHQHKYPCCPWQRPDLKPDTPHLPTALPVVLRVRVETQPFLRGKFELPLEVTCRLSSHEQNVTPPSPFHHSASLQGGRRLSIAVLTCFLWESRQMEQTTRIIMKVNPNWNWSGHLEGELNFHFGEERNNIVGGGKKKNWQLSG